jgi:hypothetical protein
MTWLSNYSYRKAITITGSPDGAQTNYQKKLVINRSTGTDFPDCQKWVVVTTSSGSHYEYRDLTDVTDYTLQSGDYLEYDIYWTSTTDKTAFDLVCSDNTTLRDSGAVDQNSLSAHPSTDISAYANGVWYSRKIAIPAGLIGKTLNRYLIAMDGAPNSSTKTSYIKNVRITNGSGTIRKCIATGAGNSYLLASYGESNITSYAFTSSPATVYVGTKCESDYDDIRLTTSDGETLLDYYILPGSSTSTATIRVEYDSIAAYSTTSTFYLYYGYASATAVNNGTNTCRFFDDFSGDLSKWSHVPSGWAIDAGRLKAVSSENARADISDYTNAYFEAVVNKATDAGARRIGLYNSDYSVYIALHVSWVNNQVQFLKTGDSSGGTVNITIAANTDYKLGLKKLGTDFYLYVNDVPQKINLGFVTITLAKLLLLSEDTDNTYFDNVALLNITTNEPALSTWGTEEEGTTAKTSSDTGSGTDAAASLLAALLKADTGAGVDALASLLATILGAETGAGVDAGFLSEYISKTSGDTGTGAEAILSRAIALAETGAGDDAVAALVTIIDKISSDTGVGIEAVLSRLLTAAETGAGADAARYMGRLIRLWAITSLAHRIHAINSQAHKAEAITSQPHVIETVTSQPHAVETDTSSPHDVKVITGG